MLLISLVGRYFLRAGSWLLASGLLIASSVAMATDCGPEAPCEIDGGSYYLRVPDGDGPHPVLIWFHGHRGSGASIHRGGGLQQAFLDNGYALLAPNGVINSSGVRSYPARDGAPRDDVAFSFAALDDAAKRAELNRDHIIAGGFSAGGSMAWLLACEAGSRLNGMVSVSGALRQPNSTDCAGLAGLPIMQVHGFKDAQVPLEGRTIRDWHQGSVWESLARARNANQCRSNPDSIIIEETYRVRVWDQSCEQGAVRMDMHDNGHGLPPGWAMRAWKFFDSADDED